MWISNHEQLRNLRARRRNKQLKRQQRQRWEASFQTAVQG